MSATMVSSADIANAIVENIIKGRRFVQTKISQNKSRVFIQKVDQQDPNPEAWYAMSPDIIPRTVTALESSGTYTVLMHEYPDDGKSIIYTKMPSGWMKNEKDI